MKAIKIVFFFFLNLQPRWLFFCFVLYLRSLALEGNKLIMLMARKAVNSDLLNTQHGHLQYLLLMLETEKLLFFFN